jgi:deazaflavin-dependent oxidoreductase (nitroreductase family)
MTASSPKPISESREKLIKPLMRLMSAANVWLFRVSRGRLGNRFSGAPVLLLTTRGRRSGRTRTAPLIYLQNGDDVVLVASKGGMPHHPLWYLNLTANAEAEVEIDGGRSKRSARRASDQEKAALWPKLLEIYPPYDDYQARTERNIPVMILSPR